MRKEWVLKRKGGDYVETGRRLSISPVLARLLNNRDIKTDEEIRRYLSGGIELLHDPAGMKDMEKACLLLEQYIRDGKKIRVIGDYDVDGVCASAILLRGLRGIGADADAVIPHRIHDGYGVNRSMIDRAHEDGVELILTCDNGIAAREEVAAAKAYGITFLITDHHEVPFEETAEGKHYLLPEADAIVDPKQEDCPYPFSGICGAFIAYRLIRLLYGIMGVSEKDDPAAAPEAWMIQLAALATVCDVMDLKDENRPLVKEGLKLMQEAPGNGIRELLTASGLYGQKITTYHLGFVLGPCINATGRIDTASRALELLTTEDPGEAMRIAGELKELNESRKTMTEQACRAAEEQIMTGAFANDRVYVIYLPDCHESIAGLVAGRVREKYSRPVLVITDAEDGAKGSARSIPAYHIYEAMNEVADLFTRFGGHAQAAGFSLPKENIDELRRRLNENCRLKEEDFSEKLRIDMELPLSCVDAKLLDALESMEPTGNGNPRAHFARAGLTLTGFRPYGKGGKVAALKVKDEGKIYEFTLFRETEAFSEYLTETFGEEAAERVRNGRGEVPLMLAFFPQWNTYHGTKSIQLIVEDYQ